MKNYLIIGGSSGMRKELVTLLENEGAHVIATFNQNKVKNRPHVKYIKLDVTVQPLNLEELPEEIHGLAYCPGSINLKPFKRFTDEDFMQDFQLQLLGATNIIKQILPRLKKSEKASILLFSTIAVQSGFSFHSQVAISKGAIEGLTRSFAAA